MWLKRLFSLLLLVSLGILFALGALELAARYLLPPPQLVTVVDNSDYLKKTTQEQSKPLSATYQKGDLFDFENPFYLRTPTGRRLRRNATAVIEHETICNCRAELRTNSLGFRGPEIGPKQKPRVLFIGDSITLAEYIPEDRSWVRQIETQSQSLKHPLQTINAGVSAAGLSDELALLIETGLQTKPDLVVLGFYLNDAQTTPGISSKKLPPWLSWSALAQHAVRRIATLNQRFADHDHSSINQETMEAWAKQTALVFPPPQGKAKTQSEEFHQKIQTFFADWGSAFSEGAWDYLTPLLTELKRLSLEKKFKLAIVVFPVADQVYYKQLFDFPQKKIQKIAKDLEVPVFDLLPDLRKVYQAGTTKLYYDWCHYTPVGNDLIAGWIGDFVQQQF